MMQQIHILTVAFAVAEPALPPGICLIQNLIEHKTSLASKLMTRTRPSQEHVIITKDSIDDSLTSSRDHSIISEKAYEAGADIVLRNESKVDEVAAMLMNTSKPSVVFLHTYEFNYRLEQSFLAAIGSRETAPFVLLIDSGDHPFPVWLQNQFKTLKGLRACYITNLLTPEDKVLFHSLPIGVANGASLSWIENAVSSVPEWKFRKNRILLPNLSINPDEHPSRAQYSEILRQEQYRDLVDVHQGRLEMPEYLSLLAQYKFVLSPPGVGYDCHRTWEILAVGSVPLVLSNSSFDERLFKDVGSGQIPPPEVLTAQGLQEVLLTTESPSPFTNKLSMDHWLSTWASHWSKDHGP